MKFCYNCGNQVSEGDKFCLECGAKLTFENENDDGVIDNSQASYGQNQFDYGQSQAIDNQYMMGATQKTNNYGQIPMNMSQNVSQNIPHNIPQNEMSYDNNPAYNNQYMMGAGQIPQNYDNSAMASIVQQPAIKDNNSSKDKKKGNKALLWIIISIFILAAGTATFFILKNKKDKKDDKKDDGTVLVARFGDVRIEDERGNIIITADDIQSINSTIIQDETGRNQYAIQVIFTPEGKQKFAEATAENIGKQMMVYVGDELITAPVVMDEITGGSVVIDGFDDRDECERILEIMLDGDVKVAADDVDSGKVYSRDDESDQKTTESIEKNTEKTTEKTTEATESTTESSKPGDESEYEIKDSDLIRCVLRSIGGYNDNGGHPGRNGISDDDLLWSVYISLCYGAQNIRVSQVALEEFYGYEFNIYSFDDVCRMYNLFAKDDLSVDEMKNRFEQLVAKMKEGDSPKTLNICGHIYDGMLYCPIMDNVEFCGIDRITKNPGGQDTKDADINVYFNYYSNDYGGDDWIAHFKQDGKGGMYFVSTEWVTKNDNGSGKPGNKDEVKAQVSIRDDSGNTLLDQTCIEHIDFMSDASNTEFMLDVFLNDEGRAKASAAGGFHSGMHLSVYVDDKMVYDWEVTYVLSDDELIIDGITSDSAMHELYDTLIGK